MRVDEAASNDAVRSVIIGVDAISWRALLRCLRQMGAEVSGARIDPMTDDAHAVVRYRDITLRLTTPLSDYVLEADAPGPTFDALVARLRAYRVRWWEHWI